MGKQHRDFLPAATGLHVIRSRGERTGNVAGVFVITRGNLRATMFGSQFPVCYVFAGPKVAWKFSRQAIEIIYYWRARQDSNLWPLPSEGGGHQFIEIAASYPR
jgi:hypothetical protein